MKEAVDRPIKIAGKKVSENRRVRRSGGFSKPEQAEANICANASCRLRKAGCRGFEGCPGYKSKG
jgi:hypothetical protein